MQVQPAPDAVARSLYVFRAPAATGVQLELASLPATGWAIYTCCQAIKCSSVSGGTGESSQHFHLCGCFQCNFWAFLFLKISLWSLIYWMLEADSQIRMKLYYVHMLKPQKTQFHPFYLHSKGKQKYVKFPGVTITLHSSETRLHVIQQKVI